jgi:hypothetical protein
MEFVALVQIPPVTFGKTVVNIMGLGYKSQNSHKESAGVGYILPDAYAHTPS